MKKSKLSISLVASFVAALGMSSCSSVKSSKTSILSFKGYDGATYDIVTDDMYAEYQTTENITKFYNQILEVMIRNEFAKKDSDVAKKKSYATIEQEAKDKVKDEKQKAEDSTESYKDAWNKILESYGVESEKELLQHFIYEGEKAAAEDWYYEANKENLTKEYIGVTDEGKAYEVSSEDYIGGKLNSKMPYHIRHILVNTSGSGTEYGVDTISEDNANKLSRVAERLALGKETFGQVAKAESDDGSASKYGDVGIMTNAVSDDGKLKMVNEFQLGIYAFDTMFGSNRNVKTEDSKGNDVVRDSLGISRVASTLASTEFAPMDADSGSIAGLTRVPYSVFQDLKTYADKETNEEGYNVSDGKEQIFPRNILWNRYLNRHNPFVITDNVRADSSTITRADYEEYIASGFMGGLSSRFVSAKTLGLVDEGGLDFKVLCDENNNPIIGVRSTYGIHLMIIQKSVLDFNKGEGNDVSLEEYYTTLVPSDSDFPKYGEGSSKKGQNKATYVNYMNTTSSDYKSRSDELKEAIKSYDSTYEYRLYESLYKMNKSSFDLSDSGKALIANIDNYIAVQREDKLFKQEVGMERVWDTYLEMIKLQNETRDNELRRVPEGCIIGFSKSISELKEDPDFNEGGICYYGKK